MITLKERNNFIFKNSYKLLSVYRRRTKLTERVHMHLCAVALVLCNSVLRIISVEIDADAVTGNLCEN